jgi:DNA polymerase-1
VARLLLLDGDNLLVRAEFATQRAPLSAGGVPTAALLVFINCLSRHAREERPDRLVVCWDGGRSTFRTELYPGYKGNRPPRTDAGDGVRPHGLVKRWLTLSNVQHVERAGWEADDLVAAYCAAAGPQDEVVIVSSDHDLLQLVGDRVIQVKIATGDNATDRWDAARVCERYRVPDVRHLPAVFGLAGDPGDGCPGLPKIGPVKAVKMLSAVDWDWDALLASFEAQPDREGWRETAELTRRLVDLRTTPYAQMGLSLAPPAAFRPTGIADALWDALLAFLDQYELRSVLRRLVEGTLWPQP